MPITPDNTTDVHIARGTVRGASCVSSARLHAASNPTIVNAPSRKPITHAPTWVAEPIEK